VSGIRWQGVTPKAPWRELALASYI